MVGSNMDTPSMRAGTLFSVPSMVAVITGGGSGIGLYMARALALNGAHKVYIIGRRREVLEEAAKSVSGNIIIPLVADVTSKEDLASVVQHVERDVGYLNLLICNAGQTGPLPFTNITPESSIETFQSTFWAIDSKDYLNTFALNTMAPWYTTVAFLGLLSKGNCQANVEQSSQVITTTSISAWSRSSPGAFPYGQSKSGATHMVKHLATQLAPHKIRCNAIAPGIFPTGLSDGVIQASKGSMAIPAGRTGTQEDIAGITLFLASRAGAYINGMAIATDGGRLCVSYNSY